MVRAAPISLLASGIACTKMPTLPKINIAIIYLEYAPIYCSPQSKYLNDSLSLVSIHHYINYTKACQSFPFFSQKKRTAVDNNTQFFGKHVLLGGVPCTSVRLQTIRAHFIKTI